MAETGFCADCAFWRYDFNTAFQSQDEQDGFGVCDRVEEMKANPIRAVARLDDDLARLQTRREFGCVLFAPR
ncbi:MAG: hypothetical protein H6907_20575 [Hyphomicrobiales bacterium]|nr:hypothetical protein [Hyphomicrobiales bacterium]MCP5374138.1 hypothetical protein [Hyphomicrobiales bacterium]